MYKWKCYLWKSTENLSVNGWRLNMQKCFCIFYLPKCYIHRYELYLCSYSHEYMHIFITLLCLVFCVLIISAFSFLKMLNQNKAGLKGSQKMFFRSLDKKPGHNLLGQTVDICYWQKVRLPYITFVFSDTSKQMEDEGLKPKRQYE